jgi:hypothetical protein
MTALPVTPAESGPRSTLVTVVAWLFLVLSALGTLGALLSVFALAVTPTVAVDAAINRVSQDTTFIHLVPAPYLYMLHHVYLVALIKVLWRAVVLIVSIGVLRRREWARRAFIAVLGIEIVVVIVALFVGQSIGLTLASQIASGSRSGQVPPGMGSGLALAALLELGVVAILLWLLFTFRSARVREEFAGTRRAA